MIGLSVVVISLNDSVRDAFYTDVPFLFYKELVRVVL